MFFALLSILLTTCVNWIACEGIYFFKCLVCMSEIYTGMGKSRFTCKRDMQVMMITRALLSLFHELRAVDLLLPTPAVLFWAPGISQQCLLTQNNLRKPFSLSTGNAPNSPAFLD